MAPSPGVAGEKAPPAQAVSTVSSAAGSTELDFRLPGCLLLGPEGWFLLNRSALELLGALGNGHRVGGKWAVWDTHLFAVIEAILAAVGQIKGVETVSCFLLLLG